MSGYNLPPGVRESDLPGCSPEDDDWHHATDWVFDNFTLSDIREALGDDKIRDLDDAWGALEDYRSDEIYELFGGSSV